MKKVSIVALTFCMHFKCINVLLVLPNPQSPLLSKPSETHLLHHLVSDTSTKQKWSLAYALMLFQSSSSSFFCHQVQLQNTQQMNQVIEASISWSFLDPIITRLKDEERLIKGEAVCIFFFFQGLKRKRWRKSPAREVPCERRWKEVMIWSVTYALHSPLFSFTYCIRMSFSAIFFSSWSKFALLFCRVRLSFGKNL